MSIRNVSHFSSLIIPFDSHKAMATKWKVGTFGSRRTYHIVVLKGSLSDGLTTVTSAYITDKMPKKQDLSASTFHAGEDSETFVLKNSEDQIICSYNQKDKVDLSFEIEDKAFEKVESITSELITQLGALLKKHLEEKLSSVSSSPSSPPKAEEKMEAPTAPEEAKDEEKPVEADKPTAPSKGLTRSSLSNLCGRVAPLLVGFACTSLALAVSHFFSSEGNIDPAIGTTL